MSSCCRCLSGHMQYRGLFCLVKSPTDTTMYLVILFSRQALYSFYLALLSRCHLFSRQATKNSDILCTYIAAYCAQTCHLV